MMHVASGQKHGIGFCGEKYCCTSNERVFFKYKTRRLFCELFSNHQTIERSSPRTNQKILKIYKTKVKTSKNEVISLYRLCHARDVPGEELFMHIKSHLVRF